jgi:hypothetical protein
MASIKNTLRDIKRYPHVKENWIKAIMEVRKEGLGENTPPTRNRIYTNCRSDGCRFLPPSGKDHLPECGGFSDSTNEGGASVSAENIEREIAENIFDWWISKKSYKKWYAEKFLQQHISFKE